MSKPASKPSQSLAPSVDEQRKLGAHLTEQYHAATNGLVEFIAFGALVMKIREIVDSARGANSSRGPGTKGSGLKAWLSEYAPEVSEGTAYRQMELAEGVKAEFKLGAKVDLFHLLKGVDLSDKEQARRADIAKFLAGKSQRQLLLYIGKPDAKAGGKREKIKQLTPAEKHQEYVDACKARAVSTFSEFHSLKGRWKLLDDSQIQLALETAETFVKEASKWLKTPPPSRIVPDAEKLLDAEAQAEAKTEEAS